ncbi:MAG: hypothetical protein EPN21_14840 [Methylococcaceae bacterium]|nr:MAG: hypothetical protein EPN21_14840 [Methylococcaceae bacterium]
MKLRQSAAFSNARLADNISRKFHGYLQTPTELFLAIFLRAFMGRCTSGLFFFATHRNDSTMGIKREPW